MAGILKIPKNSKLVLIKIRMPKCLKSKIFRIPIRYSLLATERGFSLVELLVALTILSAVLLPFLSFVSYRLSKERENDEIITAIDIAKSKMEEILLLPKVKDGEEIIQNKFLLKIKVLDGDQSDEPLNLKPVEVHLSILRLKDKTNLLTISALK